MDNFPTRRAPSTLYLYRCDRCGEENEYSIDFGPSKTHARKHQGCGPRCGGRELLVSQRPDPDEVDE